MKYSYRIYLHITLICDMCLAAVLDQDAFGLPAGLWVAIEDSLSMEIYSWENHLEMEVIHDYIPN